MRLSALMSISVAGCAAGAPATAPPASPPAVVVTEAPREPESPEPPLAAPAEPALAEIREPDPAACRLGAERWDFRELRLSTDGSRFASVRDAAATLVVPVTTQAREVVAAFDAGVRIRLLARAAEVPLYTKTARALLGIVTPESSARLAFASASTGALRVVFHASEVLATPSPVEDDLGCSELSIVAAEFDARASVTKRKSLPKRWVSRDGVSIAAHRNGPTVGTLVAGVEVGVIETRGGQSRVIAEGPRYVVSGWVRAKDLTTSAFAGYGYGTGIGRYVGKRKGRPKLSSCARELTLIGELGEERAIIGRIPAGSPYRVLEEDAEAEAYRKKPPGELVRVDLPESPWLELEDAARLRVMRSELEACAAEPAARSVP